jgi:hypothetical protein
MDDDTKRYTLQIKGIAYRFKPIDLDEVAKLKLLSLMEASPDMSVKAVMRILKNAMDDAEAWDGFTDRIVRGAIPLEELTPVFEKLMKRTLKDAKSSDDGE